jgi:hypothetical protein
VAPSSKLMSGNPTGKELSFRIVLRTVEMFSAILSLEIMLSVRGKLNSEGFASQVENALVDEPGAQTFLDTFKKIA